MTKEYDESEIIVKMIEHAYNQKVTKIEPYKDPFIQIDVYMATLEDNTILEVAAHLKVFRSFKA